MKTAQILFGAGLCLTILAGRGNRVDAANLKKGDTAPAFALTGSDGKVHKLSEMKGKVVVIAWYPKAFTGG